MQASGIEGKSALGFGERYHAPLRRMYTSIQLDETTLPSPLALRLAAKAINDPVGTNKLVPSLLVNIILPHFPGNSSSRTQEFRKSIVITALAEAGQAACEARINRALRTQIPPAARITAKPGQKVRIYRDASLR